MRTRLKKFHRKYKKRLILEAIIGLVIIFLLIGNAIIYRKTISAKNNVDDIPRTHGSFSMFLVGKDGLFEEIAYEHVIVKVEAPAGAFPEGTELRIIPITQEEQKHEIKEKLAKETEVTEDSELVSFDISFIGRDENGNEVELEPAEGKTVKISINYKKHNAFNSTDYDNDRELKMYHLEEKTDDQGHKTDELEIEEVLINQDESHKGELVADAEKFSIYTVADVESPSLRSVQTNQLDGWTYGVITFTGSNGSTCVSMMDKNLGATSNDITSSASYGYYYQWGNNYGFTQQEAADNYDTNQVDVSGVDPSEYTSSLFIAKNSWAIGTQSKVQNLRGGGNDANGNSYGNGQTNYADRQGPCPDGWHVPSIYEMGLVVQYRGQSHGYTVTSSSNFYYVNLVNKNKNRDVYDNFMSDLKMPKAGYMTRFGRQTSDYFFWSSSAPYYLSSEYNGYLYKAILGNNKAIGQGSNYYQRIGYAYPVRCFYNSLSCSDIPSSGTVGGGNSCDLPRGGTVEHGESVTGYQSSSVAYGQSCEAISTGATCNNGTWSVENFTGTYLYSGCTVADPVGCTFQGQPIVHGGSLTVYSTSSETCPATCTTGTVTCNNGTPGGDIGYTSLSCSPEPVGCNSSYTLLSTGAHGTYSSCTPYTANGNSCTPGTTLYRLESCNSGYTQDGNTCKQNCTFNGQTISHGSSILAYQNLVESCPGQCVSETRICNDGVLSGSYTNTGCGVYGVSCSESLYPITECPDNGICTNSCTPYTSNNNICTTGTVRYQLNGCNNGYHSEDGESCISDSSTAQCSTASVPANATPIIANVPITWEGTWNNGAWSSPAACSWTCNAHYHTGANNNSCEIDTFQITWKDGNGYTLKTDTVNYNVVPTYVGSTPTKTATVEFTYTFNNTWSPTPVAATQDATYTAQFNQTTNQYTAAIGVSPSGYGTVSSGSIKKNYGSSITINGSTLTIGGTTVTATPKSATAQYTYTFSGWNNECGDTLTGNCTITAEFKNAINRYTVTWKNYDGTTLETDTGVLYGTTPSYDGVTPERPETSQYRYTFNGWTPSVSSVAGNVTYTAKYTENIKYQITFNTNGGDSIAPMSGCSGDTITLPIASRTLYDFVGWYETGNENNIMTGGSLYTVRASTTLYAKWEASKSIIIQATASAANKTLKINKYFANAYTVDRGDGTTENLTAATIHTYSTAGTYNITLSLSGANRWTFQHIEKPLVPKTGTTMTGVQIIYMPSLEEGFGNNVTNPGNDFFVFFNYEGALMGLPAGSFDTSKITTVGDYFFSRFNLNGGLLTSLPAGSFDISNIEAVEDDFFSYFNYNGSLTSLPAGSFDISNIEAVEDDFFSYFNYNGSLTSLPVGSFDTSKITSVGYNFFKGFNQNGLLTSLPVGSFNVSNIEMVGNDFFSYFNNEGLLISLPAGSFDISNIKSVGNTFFFRFNQNGALETLPEYSFNTSNISGAVGYYFFDSFNFGGRITSLPIGSFDISNITSANSGFFYAFNAMGDITSLPVGSFDTSNITSSTDDFFAFFNYEGALESLPELSFNLSNVASTDESFFYAFNYEGKITYLPDSFSINSVGASVTGGYAYAFYSTNYTINKNVYDLVSGIEAPLDDINAFSDNQPKRCGVHENWLVNKSNACSITYDSNGGSTATTIKKYAADTTGVVAGSGIATPTKSHAQFVGWYTGIQTGNQITTVLFPSMDSGTLYAHRSCDTGYTLVNSECIDIMAPSVVLSSDGIGSCTTGDTYIVTGVFSESVTGLDESTLTVTNGIVENFEQISGSLAVWTLTPRSDKNLYYGNGTITICDQIDPTLCITMMDRNLGAESNDINSTGSYGYHYQRGNNYGFMPCTQGNGCSDFPGLEDTSTNQRINTDNYGAGGQLGGYNSSIYRIITTSPYDWSTGRNDNLWGGSGDGSNNWGYNTNENTAIDAVNRQGPCPTGYHIPSRGEWTKLIDLWSSSNSNGHITYDAQFQEDFKIPLAGLRYYDANVLGMGVYANIWSSSPKTNNEKAYDFGIGTSRGIGSDDTTSRAIALSVRCFKDTPIIPTGDAGTLSVIIETGSFADLEGNENIGASNIITRDYDSQGPEVEFNSVTAPECSVIELVATGIDVGCAGMTQNTAYNFAAKAGWQGPTYELNVGNSVREIYRDIRVRDNLGNTTLAIATITVTDTLPTANNFSVDEVGLGSEVEWKTESDATDGLCGNETLTGEVLENGTQGNCRIDEYTLGYTPEDGASGSDTCTIMITDNEGSTGSFTVTWNDIYKPIPQVEFVSPTPVSGTVLTTNKFTAKAEISDVENINNLNYGLYDLVNDRDVVSYSINPSSYYIFNFDNITELGEVENESVVSVGQHREGVVYGATRVNSGRYGGAYSFDGVDDYINFQNISFRSYSIALWAKPEGGEWTHLVYTRDSEGGEIYYINGQQSPLMLLNGTFGGASTIGRTATKPVTYFAGLIDEVRVYGHKISADEVQFLYNSNLRKTGIDTWEFETVNSCLDMTGSYEYGVGVTSDIDTYGEDARAITTQVSVSPNDFSVDEVGLGTGVEWMEAAGISDLSCGDNELTAEVVLTGTQGECIINEDRLEYYPYDGASGSDMCTILVTHSNGSTGQFTVTWNGIYRPIPQITFVSPTPDDETVRNRNRFTSKVEISEVENISNFEYWLYDIVNDSDVVYRKVNPTDYRIFNFDNLTGLGEVENQSVMSTRGDEWLVDRATRVSSGRYGGAYSFDGIDDSFETLGILSLPIDANYYSIALWVKPEGGEWTHLVYTYDNDDGEKYYLNGLEYIEKSLPDELSNVFSIFETMVGRRTIINLDLGHNDHQYFTGLIDEVRVFTYTLYQEDAQFLYKSNLKKTGPDTWEFETIYPCLDMSGSYEYGVEVESDIGTSARTGRTLTTNIPITVDGTGYDFGTYVTTGTNLIITGTMGTLTVTDYVGKPGWRLYFTTSPYLVGEDTQETISTENIKFKANGLSYSGLYGLEQSPYVYFPRRNIVTTYISAASGTTMEEAENNPILEYLVREEKDESDFMCEDVGTYSDQPSIMLEIPPWQVEDVYTGTLWITLQIDDYEEESINEGGEGGNGGIGRDTGDGNDAEKK